MKKMSIVPSFTDERESELPLFSLDRLLPVGHALSVNTDCLVVSLVSTNAVRGNPILLQRLVTELQMRVLLPLLEAPCYCPHEFLLASLYCSYQGLLAGLFSPERDAGEEWLAVVQQTRLLLECAQERGTWRKELKQLYNMLSELRTKLRPFGLGITISAAGSAYALISPTTSQAPAPFLDRRLYYKNSSEPQGVLRPSLR